MKQLLKASGALVVLLGVLFLAIYFLGTQTNTMLVLGGVSMVAGLILHIVINKKV